MDVFVVPPGIRVSPHAADRYLTRVLGVPVTPRKIHTARIFLAHALGNRVCKVRESIMLETIFRLKLTYKGIYLIYDVNDKRVYSICLMEDPKEVLEMNMYIPADYTVKIKKEMLGLNERSNLFRQEWPVVSSKGPELILDTGDLYVFVNIGRKSVVGIIAKGKSAQKREVE